MGTRASRVPRTVSSADRVSHSVDRPRAFLHVLRAAGSAQIRQSPEHSIPVMHALESELNLIIRKCPGWILSESVRIPVNRIPVNTYRMERYYYAIVSVLLITVLSTGDLQFYIDSL